VGLNFKWSDSVNDCVLTSDADEIANHPMLLDEFGQPQNQGLGTGWVPSGFQRWALPSNGSNESVLKAVDSTSGLRCIPNITLELPNIFSRNFDFVASQFTFGFFGVRGCDTAKVTVYDSTCYPDICIIDTFTVDMRLRNNLVLELQNSNQRFVCEFHPYGPSRIENENEVVSIGTVCQMWTVNVGDVLVGMSPRQVSDVETVISDGVNKNRVKKINEEVSCTLAIDSANEDIARFAIRKSSEGDTVFYGVDGASLIGRVEGVTPYTNDSIKKLDITVSSLGYYVENPTVSESSTAGFPQ
jgi:hypothetical protein